MANNELGSPRRSQVITNFGPGGIVDFSAGGGAAISVVVAGLEEWDRQSSARGLMHPQHITEPRLQKQLGVKGFRLPPVNPENAKFKDYLIGVRFPKWLQCPYCNEVKLASDWMRREMGDPAKYCQPCSTNEGRQVYVGPVRFVVACPAGHLDEFPWNRWVGHNKGCPRSRLRLRQTEKSGLAGLELSCEECGAKRPMEGIFGEDVLTGMGMHCRGKRPWLGGPDEQCERAPRVLQRGASNIYFSVTASALDIPPWTDQIHRRLGVYWEDLVACAPEQRQMFIQLNKLEEKTGLTINDILDQLTRGEAALDASSGKNLRFEEYEQFIGGGMDAVGVPTDFEVRRHEAPVELAQLFDSVIQVTRLREVRAIRAFTRINPPSGDPTDDSPDYGAIQRTPKDWLPAIEVRGEGIFLRLNLSTLANWESDETVIERARTVNEAWAADWQSRHQTKDDPPRTITPRFVLLHSFAHALMRQLSLECGYSSASLRERLYVDTGPLEMAGLLIYTATPDSDGTLGGLVRQGLPARLAEIIPAAINSLSWCSNDPICINDIATFSDPMNLAACHSCMLASETSCEEFNRLLDRAMLVGLPGNPSVGYFSRLLGAEDEL